MDEKQVEPNYWTIAFIIVLAFVIIICLLFVGVETDWFTHFPPPTNITVSGQR